MTCPLRSSFGAIEDWNQSDSPLGPTTIGIAIVFRGDRGLERREDLSSEARKDCDRLSGRSRIGTTLSHALKTSLYCDRLSGRSRIGTKVSPSDIIQSGLRSSFGAIEDWNYAVSNVKVIVLVLRSSFGAIEDWNLARSPSGLYLCLIAIVFRGDRGLEPPLLTGVGAGFKIAIVFRGDRGLEQ